MTRHSFIASGLAGVLVFVTASAWAADHSAEDVKKDIQRHRAIAAAHEAAAKCFEAGKDEEVCHQELQTACKGLAIGKFCGMRHEH